VHLSSDYVFDGTAERPYREDDPLAPLGVYGHTKAAGDQIVAMVPRHYIVRTSWVIGDGRNFVRTMPSLAARGVNPSVVNDQRGRLTFTSELARAIRHLIETRAVRDLQRDRVRGGDLMGGCRSTGVHPRRPRPQQGDRRHADEYFASTACPVARRRRNSVLGLAKIESTGYSPVDVYETLVDSVRLESAPMQPQDHHCG
jgi:dTDP-4-dehydrorhamnose 3,5-epimerase/reductase